MTPTLLFPLDRDVICDQPHAYNEKPMVLDLLVDRSLFRTLGVGLTIKTIKYDLSNYQLSMINLASMNYQLPNYRITTFNQLH